ncbi:NAD-dependent epimerase/dehydratase family protein [Microbacterium sp. 4R-513]|uniref:NAD-dependent epimerase/dehydratase family protein n=1 Tax=Microbacterium sp. 4R-513 TaxID=2567934 RepID=UPI0013E20604|nr:NAD-dependent epimerase/dehydratase family protein [Microbacterium sp. 4R-513]QIG38081.1 NAD-dependent epimerase/dehydratase family protein [Microbacterium sp. 4R-513]
MTSVLILGGTGWLSGHVARGWLAEGADVTCLARGGRPAPAGATLVEADRAEAHAYRDVAGQDWDEVVDISSDAGFVASAVAALADRAAHWTYVSTLSVYADSDVEGADESAPLLAPAEAGDDYDYGRAKVAAEASVRAALSDRAAIVRPGLIVGPGDPSDRFGYWVARFAAAGDGPVLTPQTQGSSAQIIDVRDLAAFLVEVGEKRWTGVANAIGDPIPFADLLEEARRAAGHTGVLMAADDDWLQSHDVQYWMGPRSLPLWLPADMRGFSTRRNDIYRSAGGRFRPLADTLRDTLADERERGLDRERRSGLTREEEQALLAELA